MIPSVSRQLARGHAADEVSDARANRRLSGGRALVRCSIQGCLVEVVGYEHQPSAALDLQNDRRTIGHAERCAQAIKALHRDVVNPVNDVTG